MFVTKQWPEQLFENYLANTTRWVFPSSRRLFFRISIKSSSNQLLRYLLYLMKQKHQTSNQKLFENRLMDVGGKNMEFMKYFWFKMPIIFPTEMYVPIVYQLSRLKFYKNFVCFYRKIFYKLDRSICSSFQY